MVATSLSWRDIEGNYLTGLNMDNAEAAWLTYPVGSMAAFLLKKAQSQPSFSIYWGHSVTGVGQDAEKAWVIVSGKGLSEEKMEADIVVGCDGGQSSVRKSLFGQSFPGFTWPMQLISNNVRKYQAAPSDIH